MFPRIPLLSLLIVLALLAGGCAQALSRSAMSQVDHSVDFEQVRANPDGYRGSTLLLAGLIVDIRTDREGTTLELLHYLADRWGWPTDPDEAGGRFLVRSERFLDPELYRRGLLATLAGTVVGAKTQPLEGRDYRYPVFTLGEIRLWRPPDLWYDWPGGPYYNPYAPWPYWYGPGWYGPSWGYPYRYYGSPWF